MTPTIRHTRGHVVRRASGNTLVIIGRDLPQFPTTTTERFLLMATIVLLPLQADLPTVGGASFSFIMFGFLAIYVSLFRLETLVKTLRHPVFRAGYAFVGIGLLMEVIHGSTGYYQVLKFFFMLMGAIFIASLCRDRRALHMALYGLLLAGVWLSVMFLLTSYAGISTANTSSFVEVSQLRKSAMSNIPLSMNWNYMAFFTAEAAAVALALALTAGAGLRHYVFLAAGAVCVVGTFLPMSRGAVVVMVIAAVAILYTHGIRRARVVRTAAIVAVVILLWVPEAVFSRFSLKPTDGFEGRDVSGRTQVYSAVIKYLPEYILIGVGISHYFGDWGKQHPGFGSHRGDGGIKIKGTHNCFAAVTVYWGLPGLLALLALIRQASRCLSQRYSVEPLSLCLLGIAVSVLVWSFFMHNFENKEFSIALGLLAGTNLWIWPRSSPSQHV